MSLLSPQLLAFVAVVKHKTVHGAAAGLHLTQTAVTQRIRSLERSLKTTLFIRSRRGMQLTPEGEALLHYCQSAKELEGEALAAIQGPGLQVEIEVTISATTSMMRSRIIPNCLGLFSEFPQLLMHFDVDDIEHRHQLLRAGDSDLVVIREQQVASAMRYKTLAPEEYVLVGSCRWKGRRLKDIVQNERIIDYNVNDQMTFDYLAQYDLLGLAQHGRYYVNRTDNLAFLVAEGVGYTTLPKEFALPYVENNQIMILNRGQTFNVSHVLAWYDRPEPPRYFSSIIDAIT